MHVVCMILHVAIYAYGIFELTISFRIRDVRIYLGDCRATYENLDWCIVDAALRWHVSVQCYKWLSMAGAVAGQMSYDTP